MYIIISVAERLKILIAINHAMKINRALMKNKTTLFSFQSRNKLISTFHKCLSASLLSVLTTGSKIVNALLLLLLLFL